MLGPRIKATHMRGVSPGPFLCTRGSLLPLPSHGNHSASESMSAWGWSRAMRVTCKHVGRSIHVRQLLPCSFHLK